MFDSNVVLFFHEVGVAHPWFAALAAFLNFADVAALLVLSLIIIFQLKNRKKQINAALAFVAVVAVAYIVNRIIGAIYFRPRPFVTFGFEPFIPIPGGLKSFPSTHATLGAAIAWWCVWYGKKKFLWAAVILAFLVGFMRIVVGVHYPSDVVAGWLLGVVTSWFTLRYIWKRFAS